MAWFQYPIRRLIGRSREVSKPRDLYPDLLDRSKIWQAHRQYCCRCTCQISKRCDNLNYQSRVFEISRDLTISRLIGYWNRSLVLVFIRISIIKAYVSTHANIVTVFQLKRKEHTNHESITLIFVHVTNQNFSPCINIIENPCRNHMRKGKFYHFRCTFSVLNPKHIIPGRFY